MKQPKESQQDKDNKAKEKEQMADEKRYTQSLTKEAKKVLKNSWDGEGNYLGDKQNEI